MQLQIADKVRIEVAKAAIGGYQGQAAGRRAARIRVKQHHDEPSLEAHHHPRRVRRLRRASASIRSSPRATASPAPTWLIDKQLKLGLDLKGGVHSCCACRPTMRCGIETRSRRWSGCARRCTTRSITVTNIALADPDALPGRRRSAGAGCGVPRRRPTRSARTSTAAPGVNGTYTFTMKPNIQVNLREEAVVQARQTIERRVNELGVTEPSIAQQGTNGDQILVQLPGVTDVERAKEIIRSTGLLELKIVEQGPSASQGSAAGRTARCRRAWRSCPAPAARRRRGGHHVYYLVRRAAAVTGRDLRSARPSLDENNRPAVSFTLNTEGAAQVRQGHRREHRPAAGDHPRRPRAVGAAHRRRASPSDGRITGSFTQEEVQNLSLILRSGALPATLDLSRGADDRPEPRRRLDPLRRHRVGRRPAADRRRSCWSTTSCRA